MWLASVMPYCLIGLGANLGDRRANLDSAVSMLTRQTTIHLVRQSAWRETAPVGGPPGQGPFLNGAALLETSLPPHELLEVLQQIEDELGRQRGERWGPRPIDLDLLLYDQMALTTPSLVVPHPRMAWRRFVLEPAATVAGEMVHPLLGWTVRQLLDRLDTAAPYVAVTGPIGAGKTLLAEQIAQCCGARLITEPPDFDALERFYADPATHAWDTELEFLERRGRLLSAEAAEWRSPTGLAVSDFWFDQSLAFARIGLPGDQFELFAARWQQTRQRVVVPKLIVLLDARGEVLHHRIVQRGRRGESDLSVSQLERIRHAVLAQVLEPGHGPVLQASSDDPAAAIDEVLAAIAAMG